MIFGCTLGGLISNKIGLKWGLVVSVLRVLLCHVFGMINLRDQLGTLGYPFYSSSLYTNNRFGTVWFVLVGAVTCGFSASMLWATEAAIVLGYPEHHKRGRYGSAKSLLDNKCVRLT